MAMRTLAALAVAALLASSPVVSGAAASGFCITAVDNTLTALLFDVRAVVTGSDSLDALVRARLFLPAVSAEDVEVVTVDSTCHRAILAVGVTDSTATAYVLRIGTTAYVVRFPPMKSGVYYYTLDSSFTMEGIATW